MQRLPGGVPAATAAADGPAWARRTPPTLPQPAQPSSVASASVPRPQQPEKGHHGPSAALHGWPARHAAAALRWPHDLRNVAKGGGLRRG